ncbi:MAG: rhomboid family intramembrane serine protease [Pseudomonadota bacterium]
MNTPEPRATREYRVHFSTGQPARSDQPLNNTYSLTGEGRLLVDANVLTFEGKRTGLHIGGPPRIALADVANVDYNAASNAFLIRTRDGQHYIIVWTTSREDAESLWALLPQEKTPEFLADQEHHDRFAKAMSVLGARSYVTPAIIAINVAVFIAMLFAGADLMNPNAAIHIKFGSNFGPLTWTGQEWRLLTSAFLHFGLIHIALNMYALYQGGALVERLYGSTRFGVIYLLAAISGSVASGWWDPLRNSAGASGAIFGVYGALLAFLAIRREDIPPSMLKSISSSALLFCLYSLVIGWAHPLIDNACHVGGLLAGFAAGMILARPFSPEARAVAQPARLVIAALAIGLPLMWLAQPLVAGTGTHAAGLRFERDIENFGPIEAALVRKQTDILTYQPNVRVNRLEVAKRLRDEVLIPWRNASKPLLQSATLTQDGSRPARVQAAMREYLKAREESLALRVLALETGDLSDEGRALSADRRLGITLNQLDTLMRE